MSRWWTSVAGRRTSRYTSEEACGIPQSSESGGDHFTNDVAVGLRTPVPDAEKIKRKCGCALSGMVDEDETMEVRASAVANRA